MSETLPLNPSLRIVQILPALSSGGVERGTLDLARELVQRGHESYVISSGGPLVNQLISEGSHHISMPVHKKSLLSLRQVRPLRRQLQALRPDIVHVRSRLPAWLTWLALRNIQPPKRPHLVSTFHGLYSENKYSEIMGCGERVIAISETVKDYIIRAYPAIAPNKIRLVHRGVDCNEFHPHQPPADWLQTLHSQFPQFRGQRLVLMPGRLSRWKGQLEFVEMMHSLVSMNCPCHGVIIGGAEAGKESFAEELKLRILDQGLDKHITLVGQRSDIAHFYAIAALVCNLSNKPEPFGRTVIEALACGTPVLARSEGGPQEVLQRCYPQGLVSGTDPSRWATTAAKLLEQPGQVTLDPCFTLPTQLEQTLSVYRELATT